MIVDFQQHYTPPELLKGSRDAVSVKLDEHGNPCYLLNPLLSDLTAHIRMMDRAGIDAGVLTCGVGFDQPDLATCRLINDCMRREEALVFKVYDSQKEGVARWTAHTAFEDPTTPPNARPRESIEIRTLAFF